MSRRCEHTSFYLAGVKIHSGESVALTPSGPLRVVCRKAKPGEINVQELPTGTPVEVPRIGIFSFDADAWRGKAGRNVDVLEKTGHLSPAVKWAYLRRAAASRKDLPTMYGMIDAEFSSFPLPCKTLAAMMRRSPKHVGALVDAALQKETMKYPLSRACSGIDDPVQLWHIATSPRNDHPATLLIAAAIARLAQLGFYTEVEKLMADTLFEVNEPTSGLSKYSLHLEEALSYLPPARAAQFAKEMVTLYPEDYTISFAFQATQLVAARDRALGAEFGRVVAAALDEIDSSSLGERFRATLQWQIEQLPRRADMLTHDDFEPDRWVNVDDEEVLGTYLASTQGATGSNLHAALEIAKRPSLSEHVLYDRSIRWMKLLHQSGDFTDVEILRNFWHADHRTTIAQNANVATLHWILQDLDEHPRVTLTALERIGDPKLYKAHVGSSSVDTFRRRNLLERMPLTALAELIPLCAAKSAGNDAVWEVATHRGVITHHDAMQSRFVAARAAAAALTADQELLSLALKDPSAKVRHAAVFRSCDIAGLRMLQTQLENDPVAATHLNVWSHTPTVLDNIAIRIKQLTYLELIEVSLERKELEVARAALQELTARDLLRGLTRHAELLPYVAERLERSTRRPRRIKY